MFGLVRDMETLLVADRDVKKLSLFQRMEWAKQSAEGIAWLHGAGLLHRDIKPTNLLYHAASQSVKIADFGLAGALSVILVLFFCSFWNFWEIVFRDFLTVRFRSLSLSSILQRYLERVSSWRTGARSAIRATGRRR